MVGAVLVVFLRHLRKIFAQSSSQWEARAQMADHAISIVKPRQTRKDHEKYAFCIITSVEHLKNLKPRRVPYLALELTMAHMSSKDKSIS